MLGYGLQEKVYENAMITKGNLAILNNLILNI